MAAMLRFYFFSFIGKVRRPLAEIGCTEISHSKLRTQISAAKKLQVASEQSHKKQYITTRWIHSLDTMEQTSETFLLRPFGVFSK